MQIDYVQSAQSSHHADTYGFNASIYLEDSDTPAISFDAPAGKTSKSQQVSTSPQRIPINNPDEFLKFCIGTVRSKSITYSIKGRGNVRLGGLPKTKITYDQEVEIAGRSISRSDKQAAY